MLGRALIAAWPVLLLNLSHMRPRMGMSLLPLFPRVAHRGLPLHRAGIFLPRMLTRPRRHRTVRIVGVHRREVARVFRRMRPPLRCCAGRGSIVAVVAAAAAA